MKPALKSARLLAGVLAAVCASAAHAHTGAHGTGAFSTGFLHPLTGLDHLLAMLALGVWASGMDSRRGWLVMLTFPVVMAIGFMGGMSGISSSGLEAALAGSVIVLVMMILAARKAQVAVAVPLVAFFGLMHGWAHGLELPVDAHAASYAAGFLGAALSLHFAGFMVARYRAQFFTQSA